MSLVPYEERADVVKHDFRQMMGRARTLLVTCEMNWEVGLVVASSRLASLRQHERQPQIFGMVSQHDVVVAVVRLFLGQLQQKEDLEEEVYDFDFWIAFSKSNWTQQLSAIQNWKSSSTVLYL